MDSRLEIEITNTAPDELDLRVTVSNGRFGATVDLMEGRDAITKLASDLRGFPATTSDRREVLWGWAPSSGGGGMRLVLDVTGVASQLRVQAHGRSSETADFVCVVEAGAIDDFVAALEAMRLERGAVVSLQLSA